MSLSKEEFARCQRGMHGPAWRAQTAVQMGKRFQNRLAEVADDGLIDFSKYLLLRRRSGRSGAHAIRYPTIAAAEVLNEDPERTAALKLMVLADMPLDEIQRRCSIEISILQAWESLYFDARNQRQAISWLSHHVIAPEVEAGNPEFASKLKVAIMAGPIAVRGMLDMQKGTCLDEADRLFQRKIRLNEKFDICANTLIDSDSTKKFFVKMHLSLMAAEQRQALAERRLAQRCAEARDRFELAKLRVEKAAELKAAKLGEKSRNAERRMSGAASRRRAAHELDGYREQALRRTIQARVAESPLSLLRWNAEPVAAFEHGSHHASVDPDIVNIEHYQAMMEVAEDMSQGGEDAVVDEPKTAHLLAAI